MRKTRQRLSGSKGWTTSITWIEPNHIEIAGRSIGELICSKSLPEAAHLLIKHVFPERHQLRELNRVAFKAAALPPPPITRLENEHVSKTIARYLLADEQIEKHPAEGPEGDCRKTVFCLGRVIRYIDSILGNESASANADLNETFSHWLYRVFTGDPSVCQERARMLEALVVACVDHGVTPPSTQACILSASARVPYEAAVAQGVSGLSDVHGGASGQAAAFFIDFLKKAKDTGAELSVVLEGLMTKTIGQGKRIPGLGHRFHTADPRCDALWSVAEETGVAAECVRGSRLTASIFSRVRGVSLPINVDGVIGAIVADMELAPIVATLVFILGRIAGLSAHYFEEVRTFPAMRWIDFQEAVYQENPTGPVTP